MVEKLVKLDRGEIPSKYQRYKEYYQQYESARPERIEQRIKALAKKRVELRWAALEHYSGFPPFCACCGEEELGFLTIEHSNGGGTKQRKDLGGSMGFLRWLERNHYPSGFVVFCMNCNWGKRILGICPHQLTSRLKDFAG